MACASSQDGTPSAELDAGTETDSGLLQNDAAVTLTPVERLVSKIRTEQDPAYIYEYEGTKFVPPPGKTLLIVGQTVGGIDEYVSEFSDEPLPGGWAAYWGIPSMDGVTNTFLTENGGRQNHQILVDRFPNTVLQSGLWMVGTWDVAKKAGDGEYDSVVRAFSAWAKTTSRPIYLRIGYEFDGQHNELEPTEYVRAYRRIVDIMRAQGVENVAFVWHSYAAPPYRGYALTDWYPGDDYVDWVAVSLFGHMYSSRPTTYLSAVLDLAREKKKPVMVAESTPTSGIQQRGTAAWDTWFVNFFSLAYEKNIKAISFINEDWERFNFPGTNWKDARLQNNELIAEAWFRETNKARYLKQSPMLFTLLGYRP